MPVRRAPAATSMKPPGSELDCWTFAGWEPDRYYRRVGMSATPHFGNGAWISEWRQRLVAPETVRMMADCGITIAVTHFFKGFGITAESAEWPRLREYVALCHEHGLKVWGYVQGGSLFYETLLADEPGAMSWAARRHDGRPATWCGQYYRLQPCLTCEEYLAYVRRILRIGVSEMGFDGIHHDNSYYGHCWCERCADRFRIWLNQRPDIRERCGLTGADHILPPPLPPDQAASADPLQIAWMEFGVQQRLAAYRSFLQTVKSCRAEVVYATNPGFPRSGGFKSRLALDPAREGSVCDAAWAETQSVPGMIDGRVVSQLEAYLFADAGGYRVLSTAWRHTDDGHKPADTPGQLWAGLAEEFSHAPAILGNNWLLRSTGSHDALLGDDSPVRTAHAEGVRFFRDLYRALRLQKRRQWAEVELLVEPDTLTFRHADLLALRVILERLMLRCVPVRFRFPSTPDWPEARLLVACQQSCLPDARLQSIAEFARQPGRRVIVIGDTGRFDEWMTPRHATDWHAWRQSPGFERDGGRPLVAATAQDGTARSAALSPDRSETLDRMLEQVRHTLAFRVDVTGNVLVNTEQADDGRLLIHLREQSGAGALISGVRVQLAGHLTRGRRGVVYAPASPPRILNELDGAGSAVSVPEFRHYALIIIEPQPDSTSPESTRGASPAREENAQQ